MRGLRLASLMAALAVSAALPGCASYSPQGMWEVTRTHVDIESENFIVRKLGAQGTAQRAYLFGVALGAAATGIPLSSGNVQARAWRALHETWDGKGSAVFHNINQEWTSYGFPGLYIIHQNTVTADIYEFNAEYVDYATRGERGQ